MSNSELILESSKLIDIIFCFIKQIENGIVESSTNNEMSMNDFSYYIGRNMIGKKYFNSLKKNVLSMKEKYVEYKNKYNGNALSEYLYVVFSNLIECVNSLCLMYTCVLAEYGYDNYAGKNVDCDSATYYFNVLVNNYNTLINFYNKLLINAQNKVKKKDL